MTGVMGSQRVGSAIAYLMSQRLDAKSALHSLYRARGNAEILRTFSLKFPTEFRQVVDLQGGLDQADDNAVLMYFAELVNARMFPLPDWFIQQWNDNGEFPPLDIEPMQPDWTDWAVENIPFAWRVLQVLNGHLQPDVVVDLDDLEPGFVKRLEAEFDIEVLESLCARERSPLKYLALAYRVYAHDCGNAWLDYSFEMGMDLGAEWCLEDLERLEADFDDAREMQGRVDVFDRWLCNNHSNIKKVRALLVKAAKPVDVRARTLVRILA